MQERDKSLSIRGISDDIEFHLILHPLSLNKYNKFVSTILLTWNNWTYHAHTISYLSIVLDYADFN